MTDYKLPPPEFIRVPDAPGSPNSDNSAASKDKRLSNTESLADSVGQQVIEAGKTSKPTRIQSVKRFFSTQFNNLRAAVTSEKTDDVADKTVKPSSSSSSMVGGESCKWSDTNGATKAFKDINKSVVNLEEKASQKNPADIIKQALIQKGKIATELKTRTKIYNQHFACESKWPEPSENNVLFKKALAQGTDCIARLDTLIATQKAKEILATIKTDCEALKNSKEPIDKQLDKVALVMKNFAGLKGLGAHELVQEAKAERSALKQAVFAKIVSPAENYDQSVSSQRNNISGAVQTLRRLGKACPELEEKAKDIRDNLRKMRTGLSNKHLETALNSSTTLIANPGSDPKDAVENAYHLKTKLIELRGLKGSQSVKERHGEIDTALEGLEKVIATHIDAATQKARNYFSNVANELVSTEAAHCEMLQSVTTGKYKMGKFAGTPLACLASKASSKDKALLLAFEANVKKHTAISATLAQQLSQVRELVKDVPVVAENYKLAIQRLDSIHKNIDTYAKTLTESAKLYTETNEVIQKMDKSLANNKDYQQMMAEISNSGGLNLVGLTIESRIIPVAQRLPRHMLMAKDLVGKGSVDGTEENATLMKGAEKLSQLVAKLNAAMPPQS